MIHEALPELSEDKIDTSIDFIDHSLRLPLFISCMTGGSDGGFQANRDLARAAQQVGIPVGLGSVRILFENPGLFSHFSIKSLAPDVPVFANLGAVQVRDRKHNEIFDLLRRLEVQSLVVHLNPGQELFQPEGDRDFQGIKKALARLCERSPVPVIVKETGFGIRPSSVKELLEAGAAYVDIAGAGGTNWILVESYRLETEEREAAEEFRSWGIPTALILALTGKNRGRILASGGLRTGMDVAKSIALGAELAGLALPFIRQVCSDGVEGVVRFIRKIEKTLRTVMLLTGSEHLSALRKGKVWYDHSLVSAIDSFREAEKKS